MDDEPEAEPVIVADEGAEHEEEEDEDEEDPELEALKKKVKAMQEEAAGEMTRHEIASCVKASSWSETLFTLF